MKDLNEILQEFDGIQELPVSEESIGAYLEGKLAGAELREVQNLLNSDDNLFQVIEKVSDIDSQIENILNLPQDGINTPSGLELNGDNHFEGGIDDVIPNSLTFNNGESVFDIDFGLFGGPNEHNIIHTPMDDIGFNHKSDLNDNLFDNQ